MITEIRKTISGTEYWDNEKKKTLFVPTGEEPGFEITVNPESMIADKELATGGYFTENNEGQVIGESGTELILSNKTIKELREYAASINVEIPSDMKKKEDIIELLS
ncbi:Rho termination factor-like protein [Bacillus sp. AG1163]|uniref:Rho termination factor N-terminal domain-containing protein n=1 Tax=Bacillus sp. AG1163 TaxID=2183999 RepID=UPI001064D283|nr:Rho termination factor N-terminal domain-containing protein [Bacillus sp. AG1163]TDT83144.1 Rho termination factor-like protein [Bacillus sp. AG1163]